MRDDSERLHDILEAIERIERYAAGGTAALENNELIQTWTLHHLQILGRHPADCLSHSVTSTPR
jgi:uncharacterized protein with HEPN domain